MSAHRRPPSARSQARWPAAAERRASRDWTSWRWRRGSCRSSATPGAAPRRSANPALHRVPARHFGPSRKLFAFCGAARLEPAAMSDRDLLDRIAAAPDLAALEQVRVAALGKAGSVTALLKSLGPMSADQRAAEGPKIHALREAVTSAIAERKAALEAAELDRRLATERLDLSLPAPEWPQGTIHPVSQVMDELAEVFADLGFAVAEGPEIEEQWYNFTALNMPEAHPARAMHDTFYCEPRAGEYEPRVLRTHTS